MDESRPDGGDQAQVDLRVPPPGFADLLPILRAYVLLLRARAAIRSRPHAEYIAWLGKAAKDSGTSEARVADMQRAARIGRNVDRAARLLLRQRQCLPRAMATCHLLRRAGIAYTATLGARVSGVDAAGFDAHAWVRVGDAVISGQHTYEAHTPLVHFRSLGS